ncbi:uncharacterized protein LOC110746717, partial [Prunus avium]|uniref:Uncharacterized protein LOC110746717 n=1 Tax=Prunus avium TaxID=42229 RepID=A0A6P5RCJ9_PRUAV
FYPLAFGFVDSETEENWTWFPQHFAAILLLMGKMVTFSQTAIKNLISKYPKSGYGKLFQDHVINLFSKYAYAVTEEEFKVAMDELVIVESLKVKTFIFDLSRDHYANAFFKGMRYGEMANSLAGSFNNWMETRLWENTEAGRTWAVRRSSCIVFEVFAGYSVTVDLGQRTCSCRLWQIDGFPCTHVVVAILAKKDSVYDYVKCYYSSDFFRKVYESPIFPIPYIGKGLAVTVQLLELCFRQLQRGQSKDHQRRGSKLLVKLQGH